MKVVKVLNVKWNNCLMGDEDIFILLKVADSWERSFNFKQLFERGTLVVKDYFFL